MTQVTTSATHKTKVTADLPDFGLRDITFRLVAAFFNAAGEEVIDGTTYTMTLDAAGNDDGAFYLPTPDNTGAAGANWFVTLPSGFEDIVTIAYSGTAQAVSDLLAAGSTTTDPDAITAAIAGKANKVSGATADNLASLTSGGDLADSGAAAAHVPTDDEKSWLTSSEAGGALGTAAYAATGDFDAAGAAATAQAAALVYDLTYPENLATAITKPTGFAFMPPFNIVKNGSTFYPVRDGRLFDVRRYFVEGDGVYYVDVTTGNDSNAGTPQAPLKSILAAQAKTDVTTIYVAPGHYDRVTGGTNTGEQTRSTNIVKNGEGTVYISRRQSGLSWVQDGTYTNCYTATRSLTFTVLDASQTDADGDILEYTKAASAADCNSTAGSWYIDGANKVYVRTTGGAPTSDIWVLVEENILRYAGNISLYLEGITIVGGSGSAGGVWHKNSASGQFGKLYAKDCNFIYGNGNGVYTQGLALQIFQNCQARKNNADGFNYQTLNSTVPMAIELNCTGFKNGIDDASDNDNGSSIHGGGSVVRLNGDYQYNWGPNVVDIETAESWNLGCVASNSQSTTNGIGFYIDGEMWIDSCTAQGNDTDLYAPAAGDVLRHKNSTYDTSGGSGTIEAYT